MFTSPLKFFLLLVPMILSAQRGTWQVIERTSVHWVENQGPYRFTIENQSQTTDLDTPRLTITSPSGQATIFTLPGGIIKLSDGIDDTKLINDNLLKSSYVYLSPKIRTKNGPPSILIFGWAFASDPGSISIIIPDEIGRPRSIFHSKTFELSAIQTDTNQILSIVGRHSLSQGLTECITSYDPFSVYVVDSSNSSKFTYSQLLSKQYNIENYCWAGPHASENIMVYHCSPNKKPRILSQVEASKLLTNSNPQ